MAPRKPAKKKPAKKTAASARHRKQGLKVGSRDRSGVKVRSKKNVAKMSKARKKAYKSRTRLKGNIYLYDRELKKYVKTTGSGLARAENKGGVGQAKDGNRYARVSERTYNAGSTASKDSHRTGTGAYSSAHHTSRQTVLKNRRKKEAAGKKNTKWAGKHYSSRRDRKADKAKAAYAKKKDRARSRGGGRR